MSEITPDRIIELWPNLSEEARQHIVEIAESDLAPEAELELTAEEEALIEQGREDFRQGRTLSLEEWKADLDIFMVELRAKSKRP